MMKKIAKKVGTKLFLGRKIGSKSYTRRRKLNKKRKSFVSLGWFEAFAHSVFSVVRSAFCQICAFPCFGHRFFYFIPVTCGSILPALLLDFLDAALILSCRFFLSLPFRSVCFLSSSVPFLAPPGEAISGFPHFDSICFHLISCSQYFVAFFSSAWFAPLI